MWGPYLVEPKDKVGQWGQRSLEIFRELAQDPATGVRLTSGIEASRTAEAAREWATTLPGFQPCERAELPAGFTVGYRFTVPLIGMPTYLDYLLRRLRDAGSAVEQRGLTSLSDAGPVSAIVNCAGHGARGLVPDSDLRPIRGQHVVVTSPGLTDFFSEDTGLSPDLLCFYPHGDTVVLGGTAIDGRRSGLPIAPSDENQVRECSASGALPDRLSAQPVRCSHGNGRHRAPECQQLDRCVIKSHVQGAATKLEDWRV
ncbi:hypothetical protein BJ996_003923 [Streptomyces phaeogriseichromatogenes]|nr:hypothetical protein [Streptomyces murinus]